MFPSEILNVDDPVLMYDRFMEEIDLKKYVTYRRVALADPGIIPSTCLKRSSMVSQKKDIALLENLKIIAGLTSDICT